MLTVMMLVYTFGGVMRKIAYSVFALCLLIATPIAHSSGFGSGSQTCPASGAKAVSSTSVAVSTFTIQAPFGNAGTVYVGGSNVSSTVGNQLPASWSFAPPAHGQNTSFNLTGVFFACSNSADSIVYTYIQ